MKNMLFSKRIVFVYSLIVIVPIFVIILSITYADMKREGNRLKLEELTSLIEKCKIVEDAKNNFDLVESIIQGDADLSLFLARPESCSEDELINTLLRKADFLEKVCEITPRIYSIRIFSNNPKIPERWPVFLSSNRISNEEKNRWSFDYKAMYLGNQNALQFPSFCTTRKITKGPKEIGYIQITYRMESVFPFLYETETDRYSYILVKKSEIQKLAESPRGTHQNVELIKESPQYQHLKISDRQFKTLSKILYRNLTEDRRKDGFVSFGSLKNFVCYHYCSDADFFIIKNISLRNIQNRFTSVFVMVFLLFLFVSVGIFFIIKYATSKIMSGVYSVMDGMKQVKEGNLSVQIPVTGNDEVGETQTIFNSMTQQLSSQIEQIKAEQSLIADTEMKAMQNQINAHFLYNVLETIRMQAVLADQDEIADSIQILGRMMRYCLRWRVHRVSLSQEIDYIRSYIYILNIRNDYVITLDINIDENLMDIEIPKMTLQPLIENAFVHAIEIEEKDASLRVFSELSEDKSRVILSVQDFGCGMSPEQVDEIERYLQADGYERDSKGSIGLKNIQQRLTVFYGADYRIKIKSKVGEGTTISVPIPFKEIEKGESEN